MSDSFMANDFHVTNFRMIYAVARNCAKQRFSFLIVV